MQFTNIIGSIFFFLGDMLNHSIDGILDLMKNSIFT